MNIIFCSFNHLYIYHEFIGMNVKIAVYLHFPHWRMKGPKLLTEN